MGATGQTTIDFGAFPGAADATQAVAQAGVGAGTLIEAWLNPIDSGDHSADEHLVESIRIIAGDLVAGVGFTVHAYCMSPSGLTNEGYRLYGAWNINWAWV